MRLHGRCHCGNIAFALTWDGDPPSIPARACGCSFCAKHGGVWTSNPRSRLDVVVRDVSQRSTYAFGTGTATFHVCATCGSVPVVTSDIDGRTYAVVNVNTLENADPAWIARSPASFEGETLEARLGRRRRHWIADVHIAENGGDLAFLAG